MTENHIAQIAKELNIRDRQVAAVLKLLEEGATVPFISRYRKEVTGSLDEVMIASIRDLSQALAILDKRMEAILASLIERELLTTELKSKILQAKTLSALEDIYLPFRPKRRTRATIAKEQGLEPLAKRIFQQRHGFDLQREAAAFLNKDKGVDSIEAALKGARDIMAEWVSEDGQTRQHIRRLFRNRGRVKAKVLKGKEQEGAKYRDYFEWNEPLERIPSHRLLALRRAEAEKVLSVKIAPEKEDAFARLERKYIKGRGAAAEQVTEAVRDGYKRLLAPSMETEMRSWSKSRADEAAIKVFVDNLRQLLMAAPLGKKRTLGLDPGFRSGCKVVCLDELGQLLHDTVIYPHPPQNQNMRSEAVILDLLEQYKIEAIAIGNGTAGRETETFVRAMELPGNPQILMVNESGASVYSASEVARDEFPHKDVTVRGAVSIARRLMDPLAELVKIDAKSIGVGQYQHDVDQSLLKKSLDDTVMSCVNAVGVEVNSASKQLLTYVSGLGPTLAQNILDYRKKNGPFTSRKQLLKVPRLGAKAYEQAAGFLRIRGAKNPLDASAVHPEVYTVVQKMAKDLGVNLSELIQQKEVRDRITLSDYVSDTIGMPTLTDIMQELAKPGRDPRAQFETFSFAEGINEISDLYEGLWLPGIVTNVADFGAFVDVGVHQDGLVHISQLANRFVKHPSDVVKVQQKVQVRVVSVDVDRKRISLSMKD